MKGYRVSEKNKEAFCKEAARTNRMLGAAAALFCIAVECFNVFRVLFFSNSGLETLNNRIYFSFYLILLIFSAAFFLIDWKCRCSLLLKNRICLGYISFLLLWCTLLNFYDIYKSGEAHMSMVTTMMISFSALVVMEPAYGLSNIWLNYVIFMIAASGYMTFGEEFNFTLTALMGSVIFFVRFHHFCIELDQNQQIQEIGQQLDERRLWLSREQYELISQNAGFITFEWDFKNDSIVFSKNWNEIFGRECVIPDFRRYIESENGIQEDQKQRITQCIEELREKINYQNFELLLPVKDNTSRWFKVQVVLQSGQDEDKMRAVGFMNDITEEMEKVFFLEKNAALDSFTGLLNKTAIDSYGRNWMHNISRKETKLAMLIFDMDDFKSVNDTYGHPCGDYVLKKVAALLMEYAPKNAKVGRLGGDEFIALLETDGDKQPIYKYAGNVIEEVRRIRWENQDVQARCTAGFAVAEDREWTYEKLYRCADEALYRAKGNGKNRVGEYET